MRDIIDQYLAFAETETDKQGNRRAPTTMTSYRRALDGFATAVEQAGLTLEELPEDFLETAWMETQQSVANQPIQLRVRIGALKQFAQWLYKSEIPCAPMRFPEVKIQPKPKPPKEPTTMSNDAYLGDATLTADAAIPSTQTIPPVAPPPAMQVAVPPPAPKVQQKVAPKNPLPAMLPSSQYKLRVRREREMDDPVWVGDFPADRVAAAGAVEPFLGREVAPRLVAQGITGDVTFLVNSVGPNGQEVGERARLTIACVPTVQSVPAPVAGVSTMPVIGANPSPHELADLLAQHRRAQEELEERLAKKMEAQQAQQQAVHAAQSKPAPAVERVESKPQANEEMEDLKGMVANLAGAVQSLAQRMEERESRPVEYVQPAQPASPQLDMVALMREMMSMQKAQQAPAPQPLGMVEMLNIMAQTKQMFAPAQVNIDVSPLEEEIRELKKNFTQVTQGKSRTMEMLEEFKAMKEVFSLVGGEQGASKPTNGLGSALGSLVTKVIENPAPLAEAVERILEATAQVTAAKNGTPPPPQKALPPAQPQMPPQVVQAAQRLLDAAPGDATVIAAHEWLTVMGQVPAFAKVTEKISTFLREGKVTELGIYFRQVFAHIGLAEKAQPNHVSRIASDLVARVRGDNAAEEAEEDEGDEDEAPEGPPDLTIRVGGAQEAQADEGDEADEDEGEGEDEEAEDEAPAAPPADPRAYKMWLAEQESAALAKAEGRVEPAQEEPVVASVEEPEPQVEAAEAAPEEQPAEEAPKKPRRKRRTKAEMAAARAAEILAEQQASAEARG